MSLADEKTELEQRLAQLDLDAQEMRKRLAKVEKAQINLFIEQPGPGTVLLFSRDLAGSARKYTFVAFRSGTYTMSWHVAGKKNTLNLIGLVEGGNSWEELLLAIGDAKVKVATQWSSPSEHLDDPVDDGYVYYTAKRSGISYRHDRDCAPGHYAEVQSMTGEWLQSLVATRSWLEHHPVSYPQGFRQRRVTNTKARLVCVDCVEEGLPLTRKATRPGPRCATHKREFKNKASDARWEAHIFATYTLTREEYDALLLAQGGRCALCQRATGKARRLSVDHDHSCCKGSTSCGRCVRGLLCRPCNTLLGRARDAIEFFARCIEYLTNPPAQGILSRMRRRKR